MHVLQEALTEVRRARFELRVANPALGFVDAASIDLSRSNTRLAAAIRVGAAELRANIAEVVDRVESGT